MRALATIAAAVVMGLAACGDEEEAGTEVAVSNGGAESIDATVSDGETELTFEDVAAGTTSTFEAASFASLSGLTVTVGAEVSTVDLTSGRRNVIDVGANGRVSGVTVLERAGGGEGDGW